MRKAIAPAFTPVQVRRLTPIFWECAHDMSAQVLNTIQRSGHRQLDFNMTRWADRVTFDMIGKSAFGVDFGAIRDPTQGLYTRYNRIYPVEGFPDFVDSLCMYVLPIFVPHDLLNLLPLKRYQEQMEDRKYLEDYYTSIIREQQQDQKTHQKIREGEHKSKQGIREAAHRLR